MNRKGGEKIKQDSKKKSLFKRSNNDKKESFSSWELYETLEASKKANLQNLINLFAHWDDSFWTAAYVFLIIESILLAAFSQIGNIFGGINRAFGMAIIAFSVFGVFIGYLWILVMHRKRVYAEVPEEVLKSRLGTLYNLMEKRKRGWTKHSSAWIVKMVLPLLFIIFWWVIMGISCFYFYIIN